MLQNSLTIRPSGGGVGAFVDDIDLATLDEAQAGTLKSALGDYGVLFFRDQNITTDQHLAMAEHFGGVNVNRFFAHVPEEPRIAEVRKEPDQKANIGGGWHTDHSYDQIPAMGSILRAIDLPETGGDTLFASMAAAYDALDDETKAQIAGLKATHSSRHIFGYEAAEASEVGDRFSNAENATQDAVHPIVLPHPVTGRKAIYVNAAFTTGIVGMSEEDGKALLQKLYAHCVNEQFAYRFEWAPGSIAMWDNRSTWHWALNDYHGQRREMHRITLKGVPLEAAA